MFLAGVGAFAIGSVVCATAPGAAVLVAGRGIAGVGAALLLPTSLSILHGTFDGPARPRAVAVWASANGLAMAIGPTVGGALAVAGLAAGAAFLRHEARTAAPMMPLDLFRSAPFSAAVGGAALMTFGF